MFEWIYTYECRYPQRSVVSDPPESDVTGSRGLPDMGTGNWTQIFWRVVCTLNHWTSSISSVWNFYSVFSIFKILHSWPEDSNTYCITGAQLALLGPHIMVWVTWLFSTIFSIPHFLCQQLLIFIFHLDPRAVLMHHHYPEMLSYGCLSWSILTLVHNPFHSLNLDVFLPLLIDSQQPLTFLFMPMFMVLKSGNLWEQSQETPFHPKPVWTSLVSLLTWEHNALPLRPELPASLCLKSIIFLCSLCLSMKIEKRDIIFTKAVWCIRLLKHITWRSWTYFAVPRLFHWIMSLSTAFSCTMFGEHNI